MIQILQVLIKYHMAEGAVMVVPHITTAALYTVLTVGICSKVILRRLNTRFLRLNIS